MDISAQLKSEELKKYMESLATQAMAIKNKSKKYVGVISALVFADIMEHFSEQLGPEGPWDPWTELYDDHMQRTGKGGNKLLQNKGHLRNAIKPIQNGGNFRKEADGILWFNNAQTDKAFPYAYAHDNDEEPRKQLSKRSFMWLSDSATEKIGEQTLSFLLMES